MSLSCHLISFRPHCAYFWYPTPISLLILITRSLCTMRQKAKKSPLDRFMSNSTGICLILPCCLVITLCCLLLMLFVCVSVGCLGRVVLRRARYTKTRSSCCLEAKSVSLETRTANDTHLMLLASYCQVLHRLQSVTRALCFNFAAIRKMSLNITRKGKEHTYAPASNSTATPVPPDRIFRTDRVASLLPN